MAPRTETVEFEVTGPRSRFRGSRLNDEAAEIAGIRARQMGASSWQHHHLGGMHTGGPDEEITHRFTLELTFASGS